MAVTASRASPRRIPRGKIEARGRWGVPRDAVVDHAPDHYAQAASAARRGASRSARGFARLAAGVAPTRAIRVTRRGRRVGARGGGSEEPSAGRVRSPRSARRRGKLRRAAGRSRPIAKAPEPRSTTKATQLRRSIQFLRGAQAAYRPGGGPSRPRARFAPELARRFAPFGSGDSRVVGILHPFL